MNKTTIRTIKDQLSFLKDNLYRYKIAGKDTPEIIERHEKQIRELMDDLRRFS